MAEPTVTRAALRRAIAKQLNFRFATRYGNSSTFSGTPSTTAVADPSLGQGADFWNGSWLYVAGGNADGDVRFVTDFAGGTITPEYALSAAPSSGDAYELHDFWSANDIHEAINRAIRDAGNYFFDVVMSDTELIIQEDRLEYSLAGLSTTLWLPLSVWSEHNTTTVRGDADSATNNTLTDSSQDFSSLTTDHRISIYDGTGRGQYRSVSSGNSSGVVTVTTNWDTNPDSTSKYAIWDITEQYADWRDLMAVRFDTKEYPEKMWFSRRYPSLYGLRLRLHYLAKPVALTSDTDTTTVPQDFVIWKACSILHDVKVNDNRVDRQLHAGLAEYYDQLARDYGERHRQQIPAATIWQERDETAVFRTTDLADPLGWERR